MDCPQFTWKWIELGSYSFLQRDSSFVQHRACNLHAGAWSDVSFSQRMIWQNPFYLFLKEMFWHLWQWINSYWKNKKVTHVNIVDLRVDVLVLKQRMEEDNNLITVASCLRCVEPDLRRLFPNVETNCSSPACPPNFFAMLTVVRCFALIEVVDSLHSESQEAEFYCNSQPLLH